LHSVFLVKRKCGRILWRNWPHFVLM